jgi:hypothetical protein
VWSVIICVDEYGPGEYAHWCVSLRGHDECVRGHVYEDGNMYMQADKWNKQNTGKQRVVFYFTSFIHKNCFLNFYVG